MKEYNEWLQNQQRQQEAVQRFLRECYKKGTENTKDKVLYEKYLAKASMVNRK